MIWKDVLAEVINENCLSFIFIHTIRDKYNNLSLAAWDSLHSLLIYLLFILMHASYGLSVVYALSIRISDFDTAFHFRINIKTVNIIFKLSINFLN